MPEHVMPVAPDNAIWSALGPFLQGYVHAMFWTECNADRPELENATFEDLAPVTLQQIVADCDAFCSSYFSTLEQAYRTGYAPNQAGIDYWLTRNGHGAGFWDRGLRELGDRLAKFAKIDGTLDLYRDDDGLLYLR